MGTSSSNGGPSGKTSLLPTYYNPGASIDQGQQASGSDSSTDGTDGGTGQTDGNIQQPSQVTLPQGTILSRDWGAAKGAFTRFTKNTAGSSIKKAAKTYVRTLGGSRGATRSAIRGITAGRGLIRFLGSTSTPSGGPGLNPTLAQFGLSNFIGHSSEETLAKIADAIAPAGATNDEAIGRDAIIATLDQLYTKILENGGDITELETMTPEMIKETVIEYVGIYIFKKWVYELGIAVEKNTVSEKQAIAMELEIKDFIHAEVKLSLSGKNVRDFDLNNPSNQQIIDTIFQTAYSTFEE